MSNSQSHGELAGDIESTDELSLIISSGHPTFSASMISPFIAPFKLGARSLWFELFHHRLAHADIEDVL